MSSLKRWRRIGGGQFLRWEEPGQEVEGRWQGVHDGQFGPLGSVETGAGGTTFPLPVALLDRLRPVPPGTEVLIRYTGTQSTRAGRAFKAFEVFVTGEDSRPMLPSDPPHAA